MGCWTNADLFESESSAVDDSYLALAFTFVFLVNTAGCTSKPSVDEFPSSGNGDACILHSFSKAQ